MYVYINEGWGVDEGMCVYYGSMDGAFGAGCYFGKYGTGFELYFSTLLQDSSVKSIPQNHPPMHKTIACSSTPLPSFPLHPNPPTYQALCPPSILKSAPVIKLLASDIKKHAAPLYSSGLLNRPSIFCFGHSIRLSGNFSNKASTMAVTMYPGEMVLHLIPYSPHSEARLRES